MFCDLPLFWKHAWTPWERYNWHGYVWTNVIKPGAGVVVSTEKEEVTQDRQKRRCARCGFHQDRLV